MKKTLFFNLFTLGASLFSIIGLAMADAPQNDVAVTITDTFQAASILWLPFIQTCASWLFWTLAVLDLCYMGITLALRNGDLYDFAFNLVKKILFFGFFWALLFNGFTWMSAIVNSFRAIGAGVPGGTGVLQADAILKNAFTLFLNICSLLDITDPETWIGGILAVGIVFIGAFMTAIQAILLAEMYITIILGQILLGFGGSEWTKDYAISFVKYMVALGMKLMSVQLIAAMANNLFIPWTVIAPGNLKFQQIAAMAIAMLLLFLIMKAIPEIIGGILSGGQFGSNPVSILSAGTAMAAGVVMGGVGMAMGGGGGAAKALAVLREASKAPDNPGGISGTLSTAFRAGVQTFKDNVGKPQMAKSSLLGGTYANLLKTREESELNNLDKEA